MQRVRATIKGKVQGVGFRAWTVTKATQLGLTGEVQNIPEGHVEVLMEGDQNSIQTMLTLLHQGPNNAVVKEVLVSELEYTGSLSDFIIKN